MRLGTKVSEEFVDKQEQLEGNAEFDVVPLEVDRGREDLMPGLMVEFYKHSSVASVAAVLTRGDEGKDEGLSRGFWMRRSEFWGLLRVVKRLCCLVKLMQADTAENNMWGLPKYILQWKVSADQRDAITLSVRLC